MSRAVCIIQPLVNTHKCTLYFFKCILGAQAKFKIVIKGSYLHRHALLLKSKKGYYKFWLILSPLWPISLNKNHWSQLCSGVSLLPLLWSQIRCLLWYIMQVHNYLWYRSVLYKLPFIYCESFSWRGRGKQRLLNGFWGRLSIASHLDELVP